MRFISHLRPVACLAPLVIALLALPGCGATAGGGGGGGGGGGDTGGPGTSNGLSANAGAPQQTVSLQSGQTANVQLDGSGSSSSNGGIVEYQWTDGPCGVLATGANPEIALSVGQHTITLTVTDANGETDSTAVVVTVQDDRPDTFSLTTQADGSGQVTPAAGVPSVYTLNSTVTITAAPDPGWQFVRWEGDSEATAAAIAVVMDANKTVTAVFEPIPDGGVPRFLAPWAAYETRKTGQANNGPFSHEDRFAWDFTVDIGTPVLAAGAGRVVRIIDDVPNNTDGSEINPDDSANAIQIDHGNGLQSLYAHLDQFGVAVLPGQRVVAGQFLGRSGNSGYSTGPHLHYEVLDPSGQSVSTGFEEVVSNDGIAVEGGLITSQNALDLASLDDYTESTLPVDAFAENNIELDEPTPPAFFFTAGETYAVSGRVTDRATNVCVALVEIETGDTVFCDPHPVGINDRFDIEFTFPPQLSGNYLLGVVSGVAGVAGVAPVTVLVSPPDSGNSRPVASIEQPSNTGIDFGQTGTLVGSGSDPDGDELTFVWSQTSGPSADIADPTSAETTFTLNSGKGTTQVRFQLIAFDGDLVSLPAEVEFRLADNFQVAAIGVTDQECTDAETCAAVSGAALSAGRGFISMWVEVLNSVEGDVASFEIRDPDGQTVLSGRLCEPMEESFAEIFLRYSWSGGTPGQSDGDWQAVYLRNGQDAASVSFSLAP